MEPAQKPPVPPRDAVYAYYPMEVPPRDDAIRLADLWLTLVRRKAVFFTVGGLILAAGIVYALLAPPKYRYWTMVELGSYMTDVGPRSIEAASTALAKINEAYLPEVLARHRETNPEHGSLPEIRVSVPKGTDTILMASEGTVDTGAVIMETQAALFGRIAQDHADRIELLRQALTEEIAAARRRLAAQNAEMEALAI
jgi:hypothetical protein